MGYLHEMANLKEMEDAPRPVPGLTTTIDTILSVVRHEREVDGRPQSDPAEISELISMFRDEPASEAARDVVAPRGEGDVPEAEDLARIRRALYEA